MDGIVHILWIMMVTREQLSENRVFDRTRPEYKESAIIALSEGLITDFSDSLGGETLCIMPSSTTECGKLEPVSGIASGELRNT